MYENLSSTNINFYNYILSKQNSLNTQTNFSNSNFNLFKNTKSLNQSEIQNYKNLHQSNKAIKNIKVNKLNSNDISLKSINSIYFKTNRDFYHSKPLNKRNKSSNYFIDDYNTINYTNINNINNIKTDMSYTNPLPLLQPVEDAAGKTEKDEEEKVKKQINYDRLVRMHQGNKPLIAFILHQMVKMVCEPNSRVEISSGHYEPKSRVIERLKSITNEDIENLLLMLPDKDENNIKNPVGYMRKCLFNIAERRDAICFTRQIKHKGNNSGLAQQEYDFEELELIANGG